MRIEADAVIDHSREVVFRAYRDQMPMLVERLPKIKQLEVESREQISHSEVKLVNIWYGSAKIPAIAENVLPPVLSWHDFAEWDERSWSAKWRLESHAFPEAIRCQGHNRFFDLGGRTRVEIDGELQIDLSRVRLVPELVASSVARAVERFIVRQITPNLISMSEALSDHLDEMKR